jgi:Predicted transcriptional regulator with C-terminal CBS domains
MQKPALAESFVEELMSPPFPTVHQQDSLRSIAQYIGKDNNAVMVRLDDGRMHIITKHDLVAALS